MANKDKAGRKHLGEPVTYREMGKDAIGRETELKKVYKTAPFIAYLY